MSLIQGNINVVGSNMYSNRKSISVKLESGARLPKRAHDTDAGADLYAWFFPDETDATLVIAPGEQMTVDTGVAVQIPPGYAGFLEVRSSQRNSAITGWGTGIIDSEYRGNLKVILKNNGKMDYVIDRDTRIAQLIIQQVELVDFVDYWNNTNRGTGGFGSTNK